jgi:hypothetical protein
VLGALACSFPPYDEGLSLGVITAKKMKPVGRIGPLDLWYGDFEGRDTAFLLTKSDLIAGNPLRGYFVGLGRYNVRIQAVEYAADHYLAENRWENLDYSEPDRLPIVMDVAKDSASGGGALNAYVFQDGDKFFVSMDLVYQPSSQDAEQNIPLESLLSGAFGGVPRVLGAAVIPEPVAGSDQVAILWFDQATGQYQEALYRTDPASGLLPVGAPPYLRGPGTGFTGLPSGTQTGFYGHHPASGRSYFSFYDTSKKKYRTFRWDAGLSVVELTDMKHRVDKVLSNGLLFSYGETMGYVYDASGVRVNRFPLGDLYLSCEITVGTTPQLFFTLPTWGRVGTGDQSFLLVLVYSIPTSEISDL